MACSNWWDAMLQYDFAIIYNPLIIVHYTLTVLDYTDTLLNTSLHGTFLSRFVKVSRFFPPKLVSSILSHFIGTNAFGSSEKVDFFRQTRRWWETLGCREKTPGSIPRTLSMKAWSKNKSEPDRFWWYLPGKIGIFHGYDSGRDGNCKRIFCLVQMVVFIYLLI